MKFAVAILVACVLGSVVAGVFMYTFLWALEKPMIDHTT